jgi:mycothiol system anti-sigma-R factor
MNDDCIDCQGAKDRLEPFVDRELSAAEMAEVRLHLEDCSDCGRFFDFQEQVKMLVRRKACPEHAPARLVSRILDSIKPVN